MMINEKTLGNQKHQNEWLASFLKAFENSDLAALHELRVEIYRETIEIVKNGRYCAGNSEVALPEPTQMMSDTILYAIPGEVDVPQQEQPTVINVISV